MEGAAAEVEHMASEVFTSWVAAWRFAWTVLSG
jgi:hypothetical protein